MGTKEMFQRMRNVLRELSQLGATQYDTSLLRVCGEDVFISRQAEIRRPRLVSIGSHVAIDTGVYLTTGAEIGDYIHIAPYTTIIGGAKGMLRMNDFSTLAAGCRVICGSDMHMGDGLVGPTIPEAFQDRLKIEPVTLERFVNVGTNVVIMPGVTLGEGSVVGANSLVLESTDPWTIYVGSPARKIKSRPSERILEFARKMGY